MGLGTPVICRLWMTVILFAGLMSAPLVAVSENPPVPESTEPRNPVVENTDSATDVDRGKWGKKRSNRGIPSLRERKKVRKNGHG